MILITATHINDNNPLYFWGHDDLSLGYADSIITLVFDQELISGVTPWPQFFVKNCSNLVAYPNINSLADAQHLLPELFL